MFPQVVSLNFHFKSVAHRPPVRISMPVNIAAHLIATTFSVVYSVEICPWQQFMNLLELVQINPCKMNKPTEQNQRSE